MNKLKLQSILILLLPFSLVISQFVSVRLLICALFYSLVIYPRVDFIRLFASSWHVFLYLIVLSVGIFYSQDVALGFRVLETNFCFLAIPIVFNHVQNVEKNFVKNIFYSFIFGLLVASVVCLVYAAYLYLQAGKIDSFFFYQFTRVLDFQPTYFAYFLSFGISVLLYLIHYEKCDLPIWVYLALTVFFFFIL